MTRRELLATATALPIIGRGLSGLPVVGKPLSPSTADEAASQRRAATAGYILAAVATWPQSERDRMVSLLRTPARAVRMSAAAVAGLGRMEPELQRQANRLHASLLALPDVTLDRLLSEVQRGICSAAV